MADENEPKLNPVANENRAASRQYAMAMELPFLFVVAVLLGGGAGYFIDRWLHTTWISVVGLLLGIAAGMIELIRGVLRDTKE